jgi:hypothetical protein
MTADEENVDNRRAGQREQAVTHGNVDLSNYRDTRTARCERCSRGRHRSDGRIRDWNHGPVDAAADQLVECFGECARWNRLGAATPHVVYGFLAICAGDALIRGSERSETGLFARCRA